MADRDDLTWDVIPASLAMRSRLYTCAVAAAVVAGAFVAFALRPSSDAAEAAKPKPRSSRAAPLVFGIYPGGAAGTVGPAGRTKPEDPSLRLARLEQLRGGNRPFVLHLYDSFTAPADSESLPQWLAEEITGYLSRDFQVELVLTYRPADPGGDVAGFVQFVRSRVRQLGPHTGVTSIQVTNEANVAGAPSAADGAYRGARDALVQGVIAAKDEAARGRFGQLKIGFNWAYQLGPAEQRFWASLGRTGGKAFADAVDWVGLDAYPGTWGPALRSPAGAAEAGKAMLEALHVLRHRFLPLAGLDGVPLHVSEAGYPTGPGRSAGRQAQVLRTIAEIVSEHRREYGVTGFRWFDLRDADSDSSSFESQYGLLRDDYGSKPAFRAYRRVIARHG
jgi:hypothetical protein